MMGKDCERLFSGIVNIQNELQNSLELLRQSIEFPIEMNPVRINHSDGSSETLHMVEKKKIISTSFFDCVKTAKAKLEHDFDVMKMLKDNLYTDTSAFNNSNGSPWNEVLKLKECVEDIEDMLKTPIEYASQAILISNRITDALIRAIDAKFSFMMYHDYIQRGYDAKCNGKVPSVVFKAGTTRVSVGNVSQSFSENVNIPKPSIDPF